MNGKGDVRFGARKWLILLVFGLVGQIAWSVENMYFNLFVFYDVAPNLDAITLMVQLSGVTATVVTLIAGALSDKLGNRRKFISIGYIIWGVVVAIYGFLSTDTISHVFGVPTETAITVALVLVIIVDCIMTAFGSTANDAAFSAWVTDNTETSFRGRVEGVVSILPLISMLIVVGGFGMLKEALGGYKFVFLILGVIITACGVLGIFLIKDSDKLRKNGTLKDIIYGFRPSVIKGNPQLYVTLIIVGIYGIACQIFMPYLIIYMNAYLHFSDLEYSAVFAVAIALGAVINVFLGRLSDRCNKSKLLYVAAGTMSAGLMAMYLSRTANHTATLWLFGISGFVMITGFIFTSALTGSLVRDYTPEGDAGKLQGVRMIFSVLLPMIFGPMIGNAINAARNIPLENAGADAMTTSYVPAPEIFLAASLSVLLVFAIIPVLQLVNKKRASKECDK